MFDSQIRLYRAPTSLDQFASCCNNNRTRIRIHRERICDDMADKLIQRLFATALQRVSRKISSRAGAHFSTCASFRLECTYTKTMLPPLPCGIACTDALDDVHWQRIRRINLRQPFTPHEG